MKNTTQVQFTCRFPSWGENNQYPAFGVKYLVECPLEAYETEEGCVGVFKDAFKRKIGREFDGEILFVEELEIVFLK